MQFTCQRSGKCCSHPNIVITLTHIDIWHLVQHFGKFEDVFSVIQFVQFTELNQTSDIPLEISNTTEFGTHNNKLVLDPMQTTEGSGIFILRKQSEKSSLCLFYNDTTHACQIYSARPQTCKNFPFGLSTFDNRSIITWVKDASSFCPGIGQGKVWSPKMLKELGKSTQKTIERYSEIVTEINRESKHKNPLTPIAAVYVLYSTAEADFSQEIIAV